MEFCQQLLHFATAHVNRTAATSPRGRALYAVDWFLNGRPQLGNHDQASTRITDCHPG